MAQVDYSIADQAGAPFRAEVNYHLAAIVSQNSGATEPAATFAYQWWADTTTGILKQRNAGNSAWIEILTISSGAAKSLDGSITSATTATTQSVNDNSTKVATTAYADRVGKDRLFDVDASVAANAMTLTINPTVLDFRSTTLTDGTPVTRTIAAAINTVISSGSTGGTTSAVQSDIVIAAIDNAGTVEVAWCNIAGMLGLSETGLISTTAEGGAGAADSASTWYSTTARTNVAYRVVGIVRSTQATAGTWATAPSLVQGLGGNAYELVNSTSMVRLNTANGYGSTNTVIRRFTNVVTNQGADITYADSATLGASFTINTPGVYSISHSDYQTTAFVGISLNSSQLTTSVQGITAEDVLAVAFTATTNASICVAWTGYLPAGSVVRPHNNGVANSGGTTQFTIVRVS